MLKAIVRHQVDQQDHELRRQVGVGPEKETGLVTDQLRLHRDGGPRGPLAEPGSMGSAKDSSTARASSWPRNHALKSSQKRRCPSGSDAVQPSERSR